MSAAQIQIILSSLDSFAGLIGQVLGADNASRRGAEDLYAQLKKARPDACATSLLQLMRTSDRSDVRSTCAVFLRKFFKPGPKEAGWKHLSKATQTLVRRELLAALEGEADRGVSRHVADGVTDLALVLLEEQQQQQTKGAKGAKGGARRGGRGAAAGPGVACGWPELLGALQGWLGAAGAGAVTREAALQVVCGLAEPLRPFVSQLAPVLCGCLAGAQGQEQPPAVRLAALRAVAAFLQVVTKPGELSALQPALGAALGALQGALAAGDEVAAEQLLTELIKTVEAECGLWRPHAAAAVRGMLSLAAAAEGTAGAAGEEVRRLAVEFVMTMLEAEPDMVQSELGAGPLASQLVGSLGSFLVDGLEDEAGWGADPAASPDMEEDDTLSELHRHGLECLLRAAERMEPRAVLGGLTGMAGAWFGAGAVGPAGGPAGEWRRRHAVVMALSQAVGACKQVVGPPELASLAALLSAALRDTHPRVRWAGCQAVGVLCGAEDLGPQLQLAAGGQLLGALAALLAEPSGCGAGCCPDRVKAHACRGLVGFLEGLEEPQDWTQQQQQAGAAQSWDEAVRGLLGPWLQGLVNPLLAVVEGCATGQGAANVPTPLQESAMDAITRLAVVLKDAFLPVFPAAMPRAMGVLARAAPFHAPSAVQGGHVTAEQAAAIEKVQVGALECAAFMVQACGPAVSHEHVPGLQAALSALCRPDVDPQGRLLLPLLGAVQPLAYGLEGQGMQHLVGPVLPLLAQWAAADAKLEVVSDSDDEDEDEDDAAGQEGGAGAESDSGSDASDQDDSDVSYLSYGGVSYRCSTALLGAKSEAVRSLEELVERMGPHLAPQAVAVGEVLAARLYDYVFPEVHASARRALPQLLHSYLAAATGTPAAAPPPPPPGKAGALAAAPPPAAALSAEAAAGAQLLLGRVWEAATRVLAHTVVGQEGAAAAALPVPRSSTRADVLSLLVAVVEAVDGALLPQAWVEQAFAAMQAALSAAQAEAAQDARDADVDEEELDDADDDSMGDEDVDLEASSHGDDDEEEEDGEVGSDSDSETPEAARERLRKEVEALATAFGRKYGDAVAAMAQRLLQGGQGQGVGGLAAHTTVCSGRVA